MAAKEKNETPSQVIHLPKLNIQTAMIQLVGDSELVVHAWSKKAKQEMLDKQTKKAKQAKPAKDPVQDYEDCFYRLPDGRYGFPAIAFKAAAVDACSHVANITKVEARGAFHIVGDLVPIEGEPEMREDPVRLSGIGNTADLRYRPTFKQWSTIFVVRYNANVITLEQLLNLFNTAGFAIGVGEWRPQKDGMWGMFHVATAADEEAAA